MRGVGVRPYAAQARSKQRPAGGQGAKLLEKPGQGGQGHGRGKNPGGTARRFLGFKGMGAESLPKKAGMIQGRKAEGIAVLRSFGHGLAEQVRPHQPAQHVIQGDEQMVQGDGREHVVKTLHKLHPGAGGDMLKDDAQAGKERAHSFTTGRKMASRSMTNPQPSP